MLRLLAVGTGVWAVVRSSLVPQGYPHAMDILEDRFAKGELTIEEFQERRSALER